MIGVGPTLVTNSSLAGGNARVYYGINPRFCFGPEISIFPYQSIADQFEERLFELAHRFEFYPLAGVNYTIETERSTIDLEEEEHTAPGINYGLGLHYSFGRVLIFSEFKSVIGELSDAFFTLGSVIMLSTPTNGSNHNN